MKVTYKWLKDFVDIKISPRALAEKLTMAGLEVISLEEKGADFVFEIEVTSNRPDWLSVIGIAREVAAITNKKLKPLPAKRYPLQAKANQPLIIKIEDKKDCPLYTAKIISGVKVGPSPEWMRSRLELVGCRSVNNIVDITNYVLFELGEPLHAFDLDKLGQGTIVVRRAKAGEKIAAIDEQERQLNPDTLVIADRHRPVAVAGVMGGKDSEVSFNTKNILLEAAVFNPVVVRRGRQKLGMQSESSYRFERGVDAGMVEKASLRAADLIRELAAGQCVLAKKSGGLAAGKDREVMLGLKAAEDFLGVGITRATIKSILGNLGFLVKAKTKDIFSVKIPSHRQDVVSDVDLIEELARIYGYDQIPATIPKVIPDVSDYGIRRSVSLTKDILAGLGLNEVITYSLIDKGTLRECLPYEAIEILNPLSKEQGILRPTVIPGLLNCIAYNLNQKQSYIGVFEIAKSFTQDSGMPREECVLGVGLCGIKTFLVAEQGVMKEEAGPLHLKGILETLFDRLGIKEFDLVPVPRTSEIEIIIGKKKVGLMLGVSRPVLDRFGIKNKDVVVMEISLDKILPYASEEKRFTALPKYPGIARDISLLLKEESRAADILSAIKESGGSLLREVKITDYYKGKQIPAGYKGLTVSCLYRSDERTLTEEEIAPLYSSICAELSEKFSAKIRQ